MADGLIADSRHGFRRDVLGVVFLQIIQRQLELIEHDILIRLFLIRFLTVSENIVQDLKELCFDALFSPLFPMLPIPFVVIIVVKNNLPYTARSSR